MFERRSLKIPITVGVTMIVTLVVLIVGWILLAVFGATRESQNAPLYWTVLTVGTALFVLLLAGVIIYLVLSIKAVNLNRRQSNFVDSVTHELKSPIASLKLYLQTLGMRHVNEDERKGFVKFMLEDVERLDTLITHLLAVGTIDQRANSKEREAIQLDELVSEIAESVCQRHQQENSIIELELTPCLMQSNRVDLDMIIRNLIDNAVKYAGATPEVHVRLTSTSSAAILEVSDNGKGIPRNMRRKIFGRFIRLGSELEREQPGTGLGLYIVSTLVRSMGGEIEVTDSRQGGAKFTARLPLNPADVADQEATTRPSPKLKTAVS